MRKKKWKVGVREELTIRVVRASAKTLLSPPELGRKTEFDRGVRALRDLLISAAKMRREWIRRHRKSIMDKKHGRTF